MANFDIAFNFMIPHEIIEGKCVYTDDKRDPGGETCYGISRKNHPDWIGWDIVDKEKILVDFPKVLVNIPELKDMAYDLYLDRFWNKLLCDDIKSQDVANMLFDSSVVHGMHDAVVLLQKAVGDALERPAFHGGYMFHTDGRMGSFTLNAVNGINDQDALLDCYKIRLEDYIEQKGDSYAKKSWLARLN